ncbi:endolytic transglycosylase MltG [Thaumasiovibrio subtropicus]|uniref:endolytic transglycosylase MltG n=1 Tax=Thaumasiovibrio subtropicus TaxID=1891207 RepID=UPI000B3599DA|nr:endolytic transglycosylase MltG [Thaumasiovibrio subtropicus]
MKRFLSIAALLLAIAAGAGFWAMEEVKRSVLAPLTLEEPTHLTIRPGSNINSIFRQLEANGWVESNPWRQYARVLRPDLTAVKAGTFLVTPDMTVETALQHFISGREHQFSITLVEGDRFVDWLVQLQGRDDLLVETEGLSEADIAKKLGHEGDKLEGLLLPETYYFTQGDSDLTILKRAYDAMDELLDKAWSQKSDALMLKSPYEVLIMASIIEKETALASERGLVSSVFNNRLKRGMRLQTDPTVIYGMGDAYTGVITRSALRTPTAYNTYTIDGLPPTPIAMPSQASVLAAVNPEVSNYYYFVADTKGGHTFSTTLKQHNRAVRVYREWERSQK